MVQQLSTNTFGTAKWIVDPSASQGTHTTIAAAITSASSGDTIFIRPGTYTENPTLKAGVNLCAYDCDALTPNVTIVGKCTFTTAGTISCSGIRFKTNSDNFLAVTGSAASIINFTNCYFECSNNTGITFSSSSSSARINAFYCMGNIGTTGITLFSMSSAGVLIFFYSRMENSGNSTTASTISAGLFGAERSDFIFPITSSGTGSISSIGNDYECSGINTIALTVGGSGGAVSRNDAFTSGTASCLSISTTCTLANAQIDSTNTNVITGAGTLNYTDLYFTGSSSKINVTTQNLGVASAFQRINVQTFTSSGTYTPTSGMKYCQIECQGSGAGAGGTATAAAATYSVGGGGGGGSYSKTVASAITIGTSQTVTVGNAGTGGTAGNNAGTAGADVSVGSICIGKGGSAGGGNPGNGTGTAGAGGVAGTGDFTIPGQPGFIGLSSAVTGFAGFGGNGGSSHLGFGGINGTATPATGTAGQNYGAGGGGGSSFSANGAAAGGAGSKGIVIITEYV